MFGLDDWITHLGSGHVLILSTVVAVLLGLRHATDPDHLVAVTTLAAGDPSVRARGAARLGLAWGAGHATTLAAAGLPIIFFAGYLPEAAQRLAEACVGVMIVALAVRLLLRWRRGLLHHHPHVHGGLAHAHPHGHAPGRREEHRARPMRTAVGAYSIGLVHGLGGSAGIGLLLLARIEDTRVAVVSLALFAACTALSMMLCSGAMGLALQGPAASRHAETLAPLIATASVAFGIWYIGGALALAPYPF